MRIEAKIKKKIAKEVKGGALGALGVPPVLGLVLYERLLLEAGKTIEPKNTYLIKCLMVISVCEGFRVYQIGDRMGMHAASAWRGCKQLIALQHIYKDDDKRVWLTESGKDIVKEVTRLWSNLVVLAKRKEKGEVIPEPKPKPRKRGRPPIHRRVRQFEPFTLGAE